MSWGVVGWEPRGCRLPWVGESNEMAMGHERVLPFHRLPHAGFGTQAQGFTAFLFSDINARIVLIPNKSLLNTATSQAPMKYSPLFILNF